MNELKTNVDSTTWNTIDSILNLGNMGAHMEKDANSIVDATPIEASLLLWLIETLLKEYCISEEQKRRK